MTRRVATCLTALALVSGAMACGSLLGIEEGTLRRDDAGADGDVAETSVDARDDQPTEVDASGDAGSDAPTEAEAGCVKPPNFCKDHCGTTAEYCPGRETDCTFYDCSKAIGPSWSCDGTNHCTCTPDPSFCNGRCGKVTNNCGQEVDCGTTCPGGGTCNATTHFCDTGCTPTATCGSMTCGRIDNDGCGHVLYCGAGGTDRCANVADVCCGGTCKPEVVDPCGTKCTGSVPDTCGTGSIACTDKNCAATNECDPVNGVCCTPNPIGKTCDIQCAGTATDNCNQQVACPDNCVNGQVCGVNQQCCTATACANHACFESDTCTGTFCSAYNNLVGAGSPCGTSNDCCLLTAGKHAYCYAGTCCALGAPGAPCTSGIDCCSNACSAVSQAGPLPPVGDAGAAVDATTGDATTGDAATGDAATTGTCL